MRSFRWCRIRVATHQACTRFAWRARHGSVVQLGWYRAPRARSVAVDRGTHRVYLLLAHVSRHPVLRVLVPNDSQTAGGGNGTNPPIRRSEEHTSELQSQSNLVCRLLLEKKKIT